MRLLDRLAFRRVRRAVVAGLDGIGALSLRDMRRVRSDARALRREAHRLFQAADGAMRAPATSGSLPGTSSRTEWAKRVTALAHPVFPTGYCPVPSGTALADDISLHHDGSETAAIALRQERTFEAEILAPYGIVCDCLDFDGTYLSFALSLEEETVSRISPHDLLRITLTLEAETPVTAYGRLNIRHGPNTETMVREIDLRRPEVVLEYDLFYTDMEVDQITGVWVDLIFERPAMNRFALREAVISRRRRADV